MAEWSKALVLGTSHFDGVGSNPTTANRLFFSPPSFQLCTGILVLALPLLCVCVCTMLYTTERVVSRNKRSFYRPANLQICSQLPPSYIHTPSLLHSCAQVESQLRSAREEVKTLKEVAEERDSELQVR